MSRLVLAQEPRKVRLGIGIVTYNRRDVLAATVASVRRFTRHGPTDFVVADDGSSDGTLAWLRTNDVPVVTGVNMGIAWNKNRALYVLAELLSCDVIVLLEDDAAPNKVGWEAAWIAGAQLWGHVNYAAPWLHEHFISGQGTPADPILSTAVTAQCSAYARRALLYGGYYDPRFRGYGHEHVEHSRRMVRIGYGGEEQARVVYRLLHGDITMVETRSFFNQEQVDRNWQIAREAMGEQGYRAPWRDDRELRQFRAEVESALDSRPAGFSLQGEAGGARPRPGGWLRRVLGSVGKQVRQDANKAAEQSKSLGLVRPNESTHLISNKPLAPRR